MSREILDAFEAVANDGTYTGSLVVVGKVGWKSEQTIAKMKGMPREVRTSATGNTFSLSRFTSRMAP